MQENAVLFGRAAFFFGATHGRVYPLEQMTPGEKNIVKCLVAVAWADGKVAAPESGVIEGLLCGFDASEDEEREILDYAKHKRTLSADAPYKELSQEERELLLANAALLTHADGEQSDSEKELLNKLVSLLEFDEESAGEILESVQDGALSLGSRALDPDESA
jgi:tellurite resistance protein